MIGICFSVEVWINDMIFIWFHCFCRNVYIHHGSISQSLNQLRTKWKIRDTRKIIFPDLTDTQHWWNTMIPRNWFHTCTLSFMYTYQLMLTNERFCNLNTWDWCLSHTQLTRPHSPPKSWLPIWVRVLVRVVGTVGTVEKVFFVWLILDTCLTTCHKS